MLIACHYNPKNGRSTAVARAMGRGAWVLGYPCTMVPNFEKVEADVGIAYGWGHPHLFEAYRRAGAQYVYADLGWWNRKPPGDAFGGFHKVCVNAREPNAYFRAGRALGRAGFPADRLAIHKVACQPWRAAGRHILIAGMSAKSAGTRGFRPEQWEQETLERVRKICPDRPIMYRPKPSWVGHGRLPGTIYNAPHHPLASALRNCWAVVTYHSNVSIDALAAGIPMHAEQGVGIEFSTPLEELNRPRMPDGREQLLADVAYCQWSLREMMQGACLRHLLDNTPLGDKCG